MHRIALILVFVVALTAALAAQSVPPEVVRQIDALVEQTRAAEQLPAVSVAIAVNGQVVFKKAYGWADLENSVPATTESLFRTASVAKPMTAVGALELVEQGKLDLDAPIQKYCPAFPQKPWPITTRELLGHLSGIRAYQNREIFSTVHYVNTIDGMSFFKDDPLLFEPGTKYAYSTYGYTVVGCVMEGASGEKYPEYMTEHVFKPAGMQHIAVDDVYNIVPHRAAGYSKLNGKVINAPLMDSSYKIPGGGYVTTAEDLTKFASAVMMGKLLKPETTTAMWTPQKTKDGSNTHYGMGWGKADLDGETIYAHSGDQPGTRTSLFVIPGRKMAFAVMINMENVDAPGLNRSIGKLVVKASPSVPKGH
jgi:serine beta-lactamase-like protein LACTB, mitochondrial